MRILLLVLLLAGGSIYEGWAKTTVTYHIITLPFGDNTGQKTGSTVTHKQYRIEAIKCKVDYYNASDKLGLPAKFKSPMLEGNAYTYWVNTTGTTNVILLERKKKHYNSWQIMYQAIQAPHLLPHTMSTSPTNGRQKASRTTESG